MRSGRRVLSSDTKCESVARPGCQDGGRVAGAARGTAEARRPRASGMAERGRDGQMLTHARMPGCPAIRPGAVRGTYVDGGGLVGVERVDRGPEAELHRAGFHWLPLAVAGRRTRVGPPRPRPGARVWWVATGVATQSDGGGGGRGEVLHRVVVSRAHPPTPMVEGRQCAYATHIVVRSGHCAASAETVLARKNKYRPD